MMNSLAIFRHNTSTSPTRNSRRTVGAAFSALMGLAALTAGSAQALEPILKPYQSARSSGMGGLKLTTGLYDDNFFGNPARVLANPTWKVTVFDPMVETSSSTLSNVGSIASSGDDALSAIGGTAGSNNHARVQFTTPAVYFPRGNRSWAVAVGLLTSAQFDVALRNSYQLSPATVVDIGPAVTFGKTFFADARLGVGITPHLTSRLATDANFTLADLISGQSLSPTESGGAGTHFDVDLGATYQLPFRWREFDFDAAVAINNVLGGTYSNLSSIRLAETGALPPAQPRTFGFGMAARRDIWGKFNNTVFALEVQNIGNNPNGSVFRLIHLGGETHWRRIALRAGLNQGYLSGGVGLDLWAIKLDLATYGEEMSLNAGGLQDRRYALRLGFEI